MSGIQYKVLLKYLMTHLAEIIMNSQLLESIGLEVRWGYKSISCIFFFPIKLMMYDFLKYI